MAFDEKAFCQSVGKRLEVVRTDRGKSRTELGRAVKKSRDSVQNYEEGKADMKLSTAVRVADELGISLEQLVGRKEYAISGGERL